MSNQQIFENMLHYILILRGILCNCNQLGILLIDYLHLLYQHIVLNHTLIISGVLERNCIISRLPFTANFCQRIALYSFYLFRLHYSFGSTRFGIKSAYIWIMFVCIVIFGSLGIAFFFFTIVSADDPCDSDLGMYVSI